MDKVIAYLNSMLETNKVGVCTKLMERARARYPEHYVYDEDNIHPFDTNYDERRAYYDALEIAYKDVLEKLNKIK